MKRIALVVLMITSMICVSQFAHAYTLTNPYLTVDVDATGKVTSMNGIAMVKKVAIAYKKLGATNYTVVWMDDTDGVSPDMALDWVYDEMATDYRIRSSYRVVDPVTGIASNILSIGDRLSVAVTTKLNPTETHLDQRYALEYSGNVGEQLADIRIFAYLESAGTSWAGIEPLRGPDASCFGSADNWPNPVDTMRNGNITTQGYMPLNPDDKQYGTVAEINAAIMSGTLNPALSHTGNAAALQWNLPAIPPTGALTGSAALELRTDVVPEPCTMALLGTGLFGLFGIRRRKA